MPVCPVSLSEERRGRLGAALLLLHLAAAAAAEVLYLLVLYLRQQLADRSLLLHTYEPERLLKLMEAGVITLLAFHIPSAKICLDIGDQSTRRRWHAAFLAWLAVAVGVSIFTLVQMGTLLAHRGRIDAAFQQGFRDALYKYTEDDTVKTAVDRIQVEGQCCGSFLYRDWFRVPWADPEQVDELELFQDDKHMKNGLWMVPWAPWSCCNASHLGPCDTLMVMLPQKMDKKKQAKLEKKIGSILAQLEPPRKTRTFRDADGRLMSTEEVLALVESKQSNLRRIRSTGNESLGLASNLELYESANRYRFEESELNVHVKRSVSPAENSTESHKHSNESNSTHKKKRKKAPPAFGARLEAAIGAGFFQELVPPTVSFPRQLFVSVVDVGERDRQTRQRRRQFYSPPQRGAVRQRQLNQVGCAEHLSDDVWALLGACWAVYLVVWLLQVAILVGARWLQTSVDLARRWGGDHFTAPGYLLFSWPWTIGEGLELQPPPEDPEAIFHMNDIEEDVMGGLGLDKLQGMMDMTQGLTSGDAMDALGAVKDMGVLEGTKLGEAASLLDTFAGGGGSGGGSGDDDKHSRGGHDDDDDHGGKEKGQKKKGKKGKKLKKGKKSGKKKNKSKNKKSKKSKGKKGKKSKRGRRRKK